MDALNSFREPASRVAVLHQAVPENAPPDERDTLEQVEAVEAALRALGYGTERLQFGLDLAVVTRRLRTLAPTLVFNLVESVAGEQRLASVAPALLEALDLPFTGNGSHSLRVTGDKLRSKQILKDANLPTPDWRVLADLSGDLADLSGLWILKSVSEDASAGLSGESALAEGATVAKTLRAWPRGAGSEWFAERYIEGREINVALLHEDRGPRILPIAEIRFEDFPPDRPRILDYAAKWEPESFAYRHTPRHFDFDSSDGPLLDCLAEIGRACWDIFGLAGYARVDVRVDAKGAPWVLEVNANPCLASDAGFMAAANQAGMGLDDVVGGLVRTALNARGRTITGAKPYR